MELQPVGELPLQDSVVLRHFQEAKDRHPEIAFSMVPGLARDPQFSAHLQQLDGQIGDRFPIVFKGESGYFLYFQGLAVFLVSTDLQQISCEPWPGTSIETIRHLLLDQVLPRVLNQSGDMVFHAGAVAGSNGAIVFLGESGSGKSTLCASFCQAGFPLLADDFLLVRREANDYLALPSHPSLRLWPDMREALGWDSSHSVPMAQYSTKERFEIVSGPLAFCDQPVPINAMFMLGSRSGESDAGGIAIRPMRSREGMMALVASSFRLDLNDTALNEKAFKDCSRLSTQIQPYELTYPRDISYLPALRSAILNHLACPA